jgi:hypothetical protein
MTIIKERGWPGHFCAASNCVFHRNTLITHGDVYIVVSTVGSLQFPTSKTMEPMGANNRYFETMAFRGQQVGPYMDADVSDELSFDAPWAICADNPSELPDDMDNQADAMHEGVVEEFVTKLESGWVPPKKREWSEEDGDD